MLSYLGQTFISLTEWKHCIGFQSVGCYVW